MKKLNESEILHQYFDDVKNMKSKDVVKWVVVFVVIAALLNFLNFLGRSPTPAQVAEENAKSHAIGLMRGLKASLKDPESAKFGRITIDAKGALLCGEVNAKNSFGGYTGMDTFAYADAAGYVSGGVAYQLCYGEKTSFPQTIDLTGWF
jgi:hypothetical protein